MKAPRIVLPPSKPSAPVVELATTPQVISPRTISYLCNPSLGAGPSLVRPPHATGSEGEDRQSDPCMAFGPEGSIGGAVLLSPRLGITGTSSSHAQGLSPHGGGGGNRPGTSLSPMSQSSSELLLARSSCSPFGSSPSPSPSDLGGSCFAGSPSDTGSLSLHPSLSSLSSSDNKGDPSIRRRGASLLDDSEATSPRVVPPFSSSTHFRGSFSASQQRPTRAPAVPRASSFKDPRPRGAASASPSAPSSAPQDSHPRAPRPVFSGGDLLLPKLPEVAVAGQPPRLLTPEAPAGAGADLSPGVVLPEPCTPRGNQTRIATGSLGFRSEAGRSARSLWSASISSSQGESVAGSSRSLPSLDGCELFDHFVDTGRATAMGMPTGSAQRKPPVASGAVRNSLSRHSLSKSGLPKDSLSLGHASSQDAKVEASLGCESEPAAEAGPVGSTESSGSLSPGERNSNGEAGRRRSPFPEHTSPCATPREHSTGPRAMSRVMSSESSGLSKKEGPGEGVGGRERERERQSEAAQAMAMAMAMAPDAVYRSPGRARRSFSRSVDFNEMGSASDPLEECCEREPDSGSGRGREREKEREDGSEGSQGEGSVDSPMGLRVPRLPSLSRLRLSSREPEDASGMPSRPPCKIPPPLRTSVHTQAASGVPHSAPISCGPGFGVGGGLGGLGSSCLGGSPGKLTRRMSGPASLKRKRPPMLDIPIKDAFTSSPTSTPPPFLVDEAREIKEVSGDGPGFAVLCKRGKRRDNMEDRYQAVQGLGGIPGLVRTPLCSHMPSFFSFPLPPALIPCTYICHASHVSHLLHLPHVHASQSRSWLQSSFWFLVGPKGPLIVFSPTGWLVCSLPSDCVLIHRLAGLLTS